MILLASKKNIVQNIIEKYFWDQISKNIEYIRTSVKTRALHGVFNIDVYEHMILVK